MYSARKSNENLLDTGLPRPGQVSNLRYSDNNYYGMNVDMNMSKSNVFLRTDMPQQLAFKPGQNTGKFSTILVPG